MLHLPFLTGKVQRTVRTHLRRTTDGSGEETYEILFGPSLKALDHHFGGLNEKHTAALALNKLLQANREFASYYADFQELTDILETSDDVSRRHALKQGLNHEMLNALAIFPAPKDENFDDHVEHLNRLDPRPRGPSRIFPIEPAPSR